MRSLPVVAVALLLVTAGCSGLGGSQDTGPTVAPGLRDTPTRTTTPDAASPLPLGVTPGADDPVDERTLYVAHESALENRLLTWRQQQSMTYANGTVLAWSSLTVWIDGPRQRYETERGGTDPTARQNSAIEYDYWTNGSVTVSRETLANGSVEQQVTEGGPPGGFAHVGAGRVVIEGLLTGTDLQYVGVERRNGTDRHVLAGTSGDSRLTLRVTSDGMVRSFVFRTDAGSNEAEVTIVRRFRTYDVGTTTVERPSWAETATAR